MILLDYVTSLLSLLWASNLIGFKTLNLYNDAQELASVVPSLPSSPTSALDGSVPAPLAAWGSPFRPASLRGLCAGGHFPQVFASLASSTSGLYSNISFSVADFLSTLFKMWLTPPPDTPCPSSLLCFSTATRHYLVSCTRFHTFTLFTGSFPPLDSKFHEDKEFGFIV